MVCHLAVIIMNVQRHQFLADSDLVRRIVDRGD